MKKYRYLLMLIFIGNNCFAQLTQNKNLRQYYIDQSQPCGGVEELYKIIGHWQKNNFGDNIVLPDKTFSANKYNELLIRLEKILPMLKEALPDLGGFEPRWHRSVYGNSYVANGPVPCSFISYQFEYMCSYQKKILLADETVAKVEICFNNYRLFCKKIDDWNINDDGKMITVHQMPDTCGKWKGLQLYQPGRAGEVTERAVVIGHNGEMPWYILTRKQYLTGYKNYLDKNRKQQLESNENYIKKAKENIENMRINKALTPDQRKSIIEKLEQQLNKYQSTTLPKNIAAAEKIYNDHVKSVNEYLDTAAAETLVQPAILDIKSNLAFKGYFAKPGQPGIQLISFASKYFTAAFPRYVPQFIVLYWRWGQHPANLKFAKEMEENFPIEKLQALIDK